MGEIQIPPHWKVVKLGEYCEKPEYGYTASATEQDSGYKFIRITDIQDGRVQWNSVPYCEVNESKVDKYILLPGDIVIARIGATTGKSFLINGCPQAIFASYLIRIRTKHQLLPGFLNFYFETEIYWQQINANKGGKLKGGVNIPIIKNLLVPLPPLPEQKAITHTLRTIQKAKETRQRELELERERKAALMQYLFTHGTRNEPRKQTEIGEIPESWLTVTLDKVCEFFQYGTSKLCDSDTSGIPVLRIPNVIGGAIDTSNLKFTNPDKKEFEKLSLEVGDLVFVRTNGRKEYLGRCAVFSGKPHNAMFASYLIRVRLKPNTLLPEFVQFYTMTHRGI